MKEYGKKRNENHIKCAATFEFIGYHCSER